MIEVSRKLKEEPEPRKALTIAQQKSFIDYIANSSFYSRYLNLFVVLLGTGLRIGEALGLRWCDIDFKQGFIRVDHSLSYKGREDGTYRYRIDTPKTRAGVRMVPMFDDVRKALQREKRKKKNPDWEPFKVDGYTGFIFLNANGKVYTPSSVFDKIQAIVADYNREETARAWAEKREPVLIPRISAHILRHTFCTRLCESDAKLKVVQDVMGHKNIRTTMEVYTDATAEEKVKNFRALEGAIYLG
jgi:integrase